MLPQFPRHWKLDGLGRAIMLTGVFTLAAGAFLWARSGTSWPLVAFIGALAVELGYRTWRHW
jgi:hypothetical protein